MRSYERRYHEGTLDKKDVQILQAAIGNPQASVERISAIAEMPTSTVAKRLSYLLRNQYIERTIRIVDWASIGYPLRFRVDIKFNIRDFNASHPDGGRRPLNAKSNSLKQLALHILRLAGKEYKDGLVVQDVTVLFGQQVDLCVTVRARDHEVVFNFVTAGLRELNGVESTMTFQEAWSSADGTLG